MTDPLAEFTAPLSLERDTALPLHSQISDAVRLRISSGEWPPNYRLPAEPALAEILGVSRGTLRRALTTLIEEGALKQVQGRGTFVMSTVIEPAIAQKLSTLSEDLAAQGIDTNTEVLGIEIWPAPAPIARLLDLSPGQHVLKLERRRSTKDGPIALLHNYVRLDLTPGLEQADFIDESLFSILERRYALKITSGRRTFSAQAADTSVAEALGVSEGTPVQYLEQVTYLADSRPIEYSDVWINSGLLRVTSLLSRR